MARKQSNQIETKNYIREAINCSLISAVEDNNIADIDFNLSIGADPSYNRSESIAKAAKYCDTATLKKLIEHASTPPTFLTALDEAAYNCKNENLEYLLSKTKLTANNLDMLFLSVVDGNNIEGINLVYDLGHDPMLWIAHLEEYKNIASNEFINHCYDIIEQERRSIEADLADLTKDGFKLSRIKEFEDHRGRNGLILLFLSEKFEDLIGRHKQEVLRSDDLLGIAYDDRTLLNFLEVNNSLKTVLSPNNWLDNISGLKNVFNAMTKKQKRFFNEKKIIKQAIHQKKVRNIKRLKIKKISNSSL